MHSIDIFIANYHLTLNLLTNYVEEQKKLYLKSIMIMLGPPNILPVDSILIRNALRRLLYPNK
jgi:hypothetical protein